MKVEEVQAKLEQVEQQLTAAGVAGLENEKIVKQITAQMEVVRADITAEKLEDADARLDTYLKKLQPVMEKAEADALKEAEKAVKAAPAPKPIVGANKNLGKQAESFLKELEGKASMDKMGRNLVKMSPSDMQQKEQLVDELCSKFRTYAVKHKDGSAEVVIRPS